MILCVLKCLQFRHVVAGEPLIYPAGWQLNHPDAQRYLSTCSQDTAAPSITKSQLAGLPITIPPIEKQKLMVKLATAAHHEQLLLNQLIDNRRRMMDALGRQLLRSDQTLRN